MARRTRIGIIRARHDATVGYVPDRACLETFFHDARDLAVFDYWESVTRGHLDFVDSALMPWVDITLAADETGRDVVADKAYAALAAAHGGEVAGEFDGWIVLTLPGTGLDGGAGHFLAGKPACTVGVMTGNHTFYCHELGHVLGFQHSYGVVNNGIEWDGMPPWDEGTVYGDPYDLMSSASFGSRNSDSTKPRWTSSPVFSAPAPAGWPNAGTYGSLGPAPSPAHVHQWDPAALPSGTVLTRPYPGAGATVRARLRSSGLSSRSTSLLVLTPPGEDAEGRGRVYVEYRGRHQWDRGLDSTGTDLARQAVVVHVRRDAPGDGVRTWYAGKVHVPLGADTDVAPAGTGLVVHVSDVDPEGAYAEVEVSTGAAREVTLTHEVHEAVVAFTDGEARRTPCGDAVTWGNRVLQTTTTFRVSSRGYGGAGDPGVVSPVVSWAVGGVAVPGPGDLADLEVTAPQGQFTAQYLLGADDPSELTLVGRGGERYDVPVTVTVTEAGGGAPQSASGRFAPEGWRAGFSDDDAAALARCLDRHLERVLVDPRDWLIPVDQPRPDEERLDPGLVERINAARLEHLAERVRAEHPVVSEGLLSLARLRQPR